MLIQFLISPSELETQKIQTRYIEILSLSISKTSLTVVKGLQAKILFLKCLLWIDGDYLLRGRIP
jgi:hypothetical protein